MKIRRTEAEGEALNVRASLALRMESHFPAEAAAILCATPELRDGTLILFFAKEQRAAFKAAKRLELGMKHFCDCEVRVEKDWHSREDG